jgi:putative tryptophan/tyrosine transport system substrate-binding protein
MDRRTFLGALATGLLAAPLAAEAQPAGKVWRIGFLDGGEGLESPSPKAFRTGMRELGYVEGINFVIDSRFAQGRFERLRAFARELVTAKPDVIVANGTQAADAAKAETTITPIVIVASDPVGTRLVPNLARPGGNITGLTLNMVDIGAKRLQLFKETLPRLSHVAVLWKSADPPRVLEFKEIDEAAGKLGIKVRSIEIRREDEFDLGLAEAGRRGTDAILVLTDPFMRVHRARVVNFATNHRLPVLSGYGLWAESGAFMTYGPDLFDVARRTAGYVDKILKGAKPGDLPIEQPTKFELVINLKTAKALGLTIPPSLLQRADQVIE